MRPIIVSTLRYIGDKKGGFYDYQEVSSYWLGCLQPDRYNLLASEGHLPRAISLTADESRDLLLETTVLHVESSCPMRSGEVARSDAVAVSDGTDDQW